MFPSHLPDEAREGGEGLLEHVVAELRDVLPVHCGAIAVHGLRGHLGGARHVGYDPDDVGGRLEDDVVCRGALHLPQVVGLDLAVEELLEAPVAVRQQVRVAAVQDLLRSVVLGHGGVPEGNLQYSSNLKQTLEKFKEYYRVNH